MRGEELTEYEKKLKQAKLLMILGVLRKYSDANNPLSQAEIGRLVEEEYEVKLYGKEDTKLIRRYLIIIRDFLNIADFGYTLEHSDRDKNVAHTFKGEATKLVEGVSLHGWYLDRSITDTELSSLIDGLMYSKCMPVKECESLAEELKGLTSIHFKKDIKHYGNKSANKQFFYNLELLSEAIEKGKRVSFNMLDYGTDSEGKPRIYSRNGETPHTYKVSPYEIVVSNGRHILLSSNSAGKNLCHYRVDYIRNLKFMKKNEDGDDVDSNYIPNRPMKEMEGHENGINLAEYMREHIYLYGGDSVPVEFIADKAATPSIINHIRDWFGNNANFSNETKNTVKVQVKVNEKAMFYWALQYGPSVEILKPKPLRKAVSKAVEQMWKKYR